MTRADTNYAHDGIATRAIHAGQEPDALTGAVSTPIYMTSTFKQDGVGGLRGGYDYSRSVNPTRTSFDEQLAAVEGAAFSMSFSSGLAAIDVLLRATMRPGDSILIGNDVYGGTYRLLSKVFVPWGVELDVVDATDVAALNAALGAKSYRYVWVETPSNPLLGITDIALTAQLAHEHGTKVVVDNTFASPILQHPLADGADAVVYSTTKYIGGHSDVVGGAVLVNDPEVVGDKHHGHVRVTFANRRERIENLHAGRHIDGAHRLVGQHDLRILHHCARNGHTLCLTSAHVHRVPAHELRWLQAH